MIKHNNGKLIIEKENISNANSLLLNDNSFQSPDSSNIIRIKIHGESDYIKKRRKYDLKRKKEQDELENEVINVSKEFDIENDVLNNKKNDYKNDNNNNNNNININNNNNATNTVTSTANINNNVIDTSAQIYSSLSSINFQNDAIHTNYYPQIINFINDEIYIDEEEMEQFEEKNNGKNKLTNEQKLIIEHNKDQALKLLANKRLREGQLLNTTSSLTLEQKELIERNKMQAWQRLQLTKQKKENYNV
jgi:hypothetical protein